MFSFLPHINTVEGILLYMLIRFSNYNLCGLHSCCYFVSAVLVMTNPLEVSCRIAQERELMYTGFLKTKLCDHEMGPEWVLSDEL